MTIRRATEAGSRFHAPTKPATRSWSRVRPFGTTIGARAAPVTNTVLTSGWASSHPITWVFHVAHWEEIGSPECGLASDSGQCGRPISRTRQRLRSATTRSAARQ